MKRKIFSRINKVRAARFARKSKKMIARTLSGMGQEARETRDMANSFFRLLETKLKLNERSVPPTDEEVAAALEQLKDVGRFTIFSGISILPGGGFSLLGLEMLAKKMGVKNFTFIPSAFRKQETGIIVKENKVIIKDKLNPDTGIKE